MIRIPNCSSFQRLFADAAVAFSLEHAAILVSFACVHEPWHSQVINSISKRKFNKICKDLIAVGFLEDVK